MGDFSGLTVVVTGGAQGIGRAVAQAFTSAGATVAAFDRSFDPDDPPAAQSVVVDVTDRASVAAGVAEVVNSTGRIDIVVNNAGISAIGTVEDNDDSEWHRVLDVNVVGMARVSAAALPWLRKSPSASIVNVCSIAAQSGLPQRALYSASKGAVLSLTLAMAADHVGEGIRVNCVSPGTVHTPFVDQMLARFADVEAERAQLHARQATGRMVTTDEVADAVLYLANPRSRSTTGAVLDVDGGVHTLRVRAPGTVVR